MLLITSVEKYTIKGSRELTRLAGALLLIDHYHFCFREVLMTRQPLAVVVGLCTKVGCGCLLMAQEEDRRCL